MTTDFPLDDDGASEVDGGASHFVKLTYCIVAHVSAFITLCQRNSRTYSFKQLMEWPEIDVDGRKYK